MSLQKRRQLKWLIKTAGFSLKNINQKNACNTIITNNNFILFLRLGTKAYHQRYYNCHESSLGTGKRTQENVSINSIKMGSSEKANYDH